MASTQNEIYERARLARDTRFDGRFFIGVRTTGIYCRPICPANPPKSENVSFFPTAAAAAEAGYRPCLRCRPESAPGTPAWAGTSTTVQRGLRLIANGALDEGSIESLSDRLGVTSRHLRRLFRKHLGASPQAVAHTQRLHFAKRLIDDTRLPLSRVAEAAGYGSIRRFNDAFLNSYGRAPGALRKLREEIPSEDGAAMSVTLSYRQPFDWPAMLRYLAPRATPGVEVVEADSYRRTVAIGDSKGMIEIYPEPRRDRLRMTLHGVTTANLFQSVQRARTMLDLDAPVDDIARALARDRLLARRLESLPGIRVPGAWDGFELAVRAILGQQVSVAGATTLAGRLAERYGEPLDSAHDARSGDPARLFPTPRRLAKAPLEELGVIGSRASAIRSLARMVLAGDLDFDDAQDEAAFVARITSIKGIGEWTAQYLCMRVLKNPDAFPATDLGLRKAFEPARRLAPGELNSMAEDWRPWRAYAAMLLWQNSNTKGG